MSRQCQTMRSTLNISPSAVKAFQEMTSLTPFSGTVRVVWTYGS
ncbi:hypothetical protein ACP4OV_030359 [Aristida adscensionis]